MRSTVLFLVFNRPDTTRQVFEAIRKAQPPRLYISADGARSHKDGEAEICSEVRKIATSVDWPCEVKTMFREKNLGCRVAVSEGITWFFKHEEEGIILEDDCLVGKSWFNFAESMLERYRYDNRIMCISANHFHGDQHKLEHSYFFSRYNHCWGWASWRRAWQYYDKDMSSWPKLKNTSWLLSAGNGSKSFQRYWYKIFETVYDNKVDSWAYCWTFSCWCQHGLTILPAKNLVKNIGFGFDATHTKNSKPHFFNQLEELNSNYSHPPLIIVDDEADQWTHNNIFSNRILLKIKRFLYCNE